MQCQLLNNVCIHRNLTRKKFIKQSLSLLVPHIFVSSYLPYKTPAADIQNICTPFYLVPLSNLGNLVMEPFAMFIKDGCHVFRKKKSKWECRK